MTRSDNSNHLLLIWIFSQIGEAVVGFDVEKLLADTVLSGGGGGGGDEMARRFGVGPRRVDGRRVDGRRRRAGRAVGRGRRCDDGHAGGRGRHSGRIGLPAHVLRVGQLVVLLPLHAPVLEPDLDLALRQAQAVRDLDASPARQVAVEVELFLQLEDLVARVGGALAFRLHARLEAAVGRKENRSI